MNFVSIRIITADVARLVGFYEKTTGVPADWATPEFASITTRGLTLAIGSERTAPLATPATNRSVIVEFLVDDVDAFYGTLTDVDVVMEPTTMPWGNRSLLLRDPDGNLVNFFKR
ncbi:VOC family protein [Cryptosporangium sp. NPDC048952]|uniref:VOC family protein n=1 Tax=Cryptosporangium sp. NPDC048952 TaxID=3363961 RepID=UPI00371AD394